MQVPAKNARPMLGATSRALAERIAQGGDDAQLAYMTSFVADISEALAHGSIASVVDAVRARASARGIVTDRALEEALREYRTAGHVLRAALRDEGAWTEERDDVITDALHVAVAAVSRTATLGAPVEGSRALLEEVLRQLPVGVSITDARTGRGMFHNVETIRLVERSGSERTTFADYAGYGAIHPDGRPYTAEEYPTVRAIRTGATIRDEEMLYRHHDGALLTLLVSSSPLRDDIGKVTVAVTSVVDITERAEAKQRVADSETALREITNRLRIIADSVPIHLLLLDRNERVQFANAAAAALWKRSPETFIGTTIADVVGPDAQRALAPYTERVLRGETVSYESPFESPTGERRTFLNTYSPHRSVTGEVQGFVATGIDITARKLDEERLRATVSELQQERELRERFVAALSHDLRTPLSAARMGADLLIRSGDDTSRVQRLATRIVDNIERANQMIRDLLDVHLLRAQGTLPIERTRCDLAAIARRALDELGSVHGNRFVLLAPPTLEDVLDCDGLRRIVENLCTNAVKYGDAHAPITVRLTPSDRTLAIEVHNVGPPIPPSDLPHLFEPYQRTESAQASGLRGWGVGLALVKGIAEAHGGGVSVTSSAAAGTTFKVVLPRHHA